MKKESITEAYASSRGQPKWLDVKTAKQRSKRQENDVASKLNGSVQPGSGNQNHSPGDVKMESVLIECKTTKHKSYRVTVDLIKKIRAEAKSMNKEWAIVLDIEDTVYHDKEQVVILDFDLFTVLMEVVYGIEKHA